MISSTERQQAAEQAALLLGAQPLFHHSLHIACYYPLLDEFNSLPLIKAIWDANKHCYLPVVANEKVLRFIPYHKEDPLHKNRYGILEPIQQNAFISPTELDMVITPLLAFDFAGHRLGVGGGYYDHTFAFLQAIEDKKKPTLIGLAYEMQRWDTIPVDAWDIHLDAIVTEQAYYPCIFTDSSQLTPGVRE
jgi:5-formyltetrahydrofolate cyclo-ligase